VAAVPPFRSVVRADEYVPRRHPELLERVGSVRIAGGRRLEDGEGFPGERDDALEEETFRLLRIPEDHEVVPADRMRAIPLPVGEESVPRSERRGHAPVDDDEPSAGEPASPPREHSGRRLLLTELRHLYATSRGCARMSARALNRTESLVAFLRPTTPVYAHCDIPCGIYDPHEAQISALTVVRMMQLIQELPKPAAGAKPEELEAYSAKLARYMLVKEQHAERTKAELRSLWGDYFTPDHVKAHPALHETFFKAMKQASKARQGTALADAQELLKNVQEIAEIFWTTKGAKVHRMPSMQKAGGELIYPAPA
jgi:nickel superoxide dismutase